MSASRIQAIPVTDINANVVNPTFTDINPDGLPRACFLLRIINDSNISIAVSYDGGTTVHDLVPANSVLQIPGQSNSNKNTNANFPQGMVVSVSGNMGGTGEIGLAGYYLQQT